MPSRPMRMQQCKVLLLTLTSDLN